MPPPSSFPSASASPWRDRRRPGAARSGEHAPGQLLRLLDVRLVERVDAQDDAGDRRRDLPADDLAGEVDRVVELDPDDRVAGALERIGELGHARRRRCPRGSARRTRDPRRTRSRGRSGSPSTGTIPTPCLPVDSAMSCSSQAPKLAICGIGEERQLVAARRGEPTDRQPEQDARIHARVRLAARTEHRRRGGQEGVEVQSDERRRDEADVGERRVAPADVGRVQELLAQVVVVRDRLDAPARGR